MCKGTPTKTHSTAQRTLQDQVLRKYYPTDTKSRYNPDYNLKVVLENLLPGKVIFYFSTQGANPETDTKVLSRTVSYKNLSNSGVTRVSADGKAVLKLRCPRVYFNPENTKAYPRHVHYTYADSSSNTPDKKPWSLRLHTQKVFCPVSAKSLENILHARSAAVIDALPSDYYNKEHIKGAANIPHNNLDKVDVASVKQTISRSFPDLYNKYSNNIRHIPIIIYCYSPECNAAEHLKEHLDKLGFVNTWHYEGGISEWKGEKETLPAPFYASSQTFVSSTWISPNGKKHSVEKALIVQRDHMDPKPVVTYMERKDGKIVRRKSV